MYRSTTSFTTKDYDVRPRQILEDDFTSQEEIQEFLRIGYIEVYDDTLDITENGLYDVEDYQNADVNVPSSEPVLQSKDITINQNGTTTITADTGYDGLSDVDVTVSGILDTSDANAVANNIESGKTAYVNGQKITGNIETILNSQLDTENIKKFINRPANNGIEVAIGTPNKKILLGAPSSLGATVPYTRVATTIGLTANKLKKDEVVCGVTGTYEGTNTPDWSEIGYSDVPQALLDDFAYSKDIYDNWDSTITSMSQKYYQNYNLVYMPSVNTSNVTNMYYAFAYSPQLKVIGQLDTSNVGNIQGAFMACQYLKDVPVLNLAKVYNLQSIFSSCGRLSNISLNNIMESLITATTYSGTKTLAYVGLSQAQAETCQTLSNWNDFVNAGWSTGY